MNGGYCETRSEAKPSTNSINERKLAKKIFCLKQGCPEAALTKRRSKKSPECYLFHFIVHRVECGARGENVQNKRTHHPKRLTHFSDGSWARDIWEWEFSASSEASERSLRIYWEFPLSTDSTAFRYWTQLSIRLGEKYRNEEMNEKTTQSQIAASTSETPF